MEEGAVNSRRGEGLRKVLTELNLFLLEKHSVRITCVQCIMLDIVDIYICE